jgi:DNA-binding NtrC family response regulator
MVVYLPATARIAQARGASLAAEPRTFGGGAILLVDDEASVRRATRSMLEQAGCKVIEAENGRDAVSAYQAQGSQVRAVLMDVTMPVMGGEAALRELLAINSDLKVVLVSGYTEMETAMNLVGLRPAAFLQKPYRYSQLLEVLTAILG